MKERYDTTSAKHYAAFRPALHGLILDRAIHPGEFFRNGLDVGCGTGYSAIALTKYCGKVFGLDVSQAMLDLAQGHPNVTYVQGTGDALNFPAHAFDIVTFAGSLFYTKTAKLRSELVRVCQPGGTIIVYDFNILLKDILFAVGIDSPLDSSDYDYHASLSDCAEIVTESKCIEQLQLKLSEQEIAHLILADSIYYDAISKRFTFGDPFATLVDALKRRSNKLNVCADIFFSRYRMA